jgi:Flp pilus assembly protein TadD
MRMIALVIVALLAACAQHRQDLADRPPSLKVAETAMESGNPQVALQICAGWVTREPGNLEAVTCQGDALAALGRREEAEAAFQGAAKTWPDSTQVSMGLGRLRLASDPLAAETLFQRVVDREPTNAAAWNDIGIARDLQGRHAQAQEAYGRALGAVPGMRAAEVNLALSMAMSGRAEEAVQRLRSLAADPNASPRLRHDLAAALAMANHPEEAARLLRGDLRPEEIEQAIAGYRALPDAAQPTAVAPPPAPRPAAPADPPASASQPAAGVVLQARADAWVRVAERHGRALVNRLMHAGESWSVPPGSDPAQLLLSTGNAGGIEVLVDGQPVPSLGKEGAVRHDIPLDPEALREGQVRAAHPPPSQP